MFGKFSCGESDCCKNQINKRLQLNLVFSLGMKSVPAVTFYDWE